MTNARRQTIGYSPTSSRAVYPAPDMATARLVDKLRQRGASNPQMARASSSALIEDEYELAGGGMRAEPAPRFDNNYSPYSSVNAEAVAEARRRAEEKKRMEAMAARARRVRAGRVARHDKYAAGAETAERCASCAPHHRCGGQTASGKACAGPPLIRRGTARRIGTARGRAETRPVPEARDRDRVFVLGSVFHGSGIRAQL